MFHINIPSFLIPFLQIIRNLTFKIKLQGILLMLLMLVASFLDIMTLYIFYPFVSLVSNSDSSKLPSFIVIYLESISLHHSFPIVALLGIIFISFVFISSLFRILAVGLTYRYSSNVGVYLSTAAYKNILGWDYLKHVSSKSSSIVPALTNHLPKVLTSINCSLLLLSNLILSASIVVSLCFISINLTLFFFGSVIIIYLLIANITSPKLKYYGLTAADKLSLQYKLVTETLESIRDIIIESSSSFYLHRYHQLDRQMRLSQAKADLLAVIPRYLVEAFFFSIFVAYLIFSSLISPGSTTTTFALISTFALSFLKLLPALQQIFANWSFITNNSSPSYSFLMLLNEPTNALSYSDLLVDTSKDNLIAGSQFSHLEFRDVCFKYNVDSNEFDLENINLLISSGETVAFTGSTGSGKSTLIDLIMGLLTPTSGDILVNSQSVLRDSSKTYLSSHLKSWHNIITHVPQRVTLRDSSILENICGLDFLSGSIDYDRLDSALRLSSSTFIYDLPGNLDFHVGERGISLSGGQSQRIAIARALYMAKELLIMDEATSSLDPSTSYQIHENLYRYYNHLTIIYVTHRPETLHRCNQKIILKSGSIVH